MPLKQTKGKAAFSSNVKELRAAGHSMKQSLAIAYNVKRHPKPKGR
jgi:hypothetical protein